MDIHKISQDQDAAKRIRDCVSLHLVAHSKDIFQVVGKWCVFRLSDGTTDGGLYDSKNEAIKAKEPREKEFCYLKITPDGISEKDAFHFLKVNRHPMIDTTSPEHAINPKIFMPSATIFNPEQEQ